MKRLQSLLVWCLTVSLLLAACQSAPADGAKAAEPDVPSAAEPEPTPPQSPLSAGTARRRTPSSPCLRAGGWSGRRGQTVLSPTARTTAGVEAPSPGICRGIRHWHTL